MELNSWLPLQGGNAGLDALLRLYAVGREDVKVVNLVSAETVVPNLRARLKARMLGGDPPDLLQDRAGRPFVDPWVLLDKLEPLDELFGSAHLYRWMPQGMRDLVSFRERLWSLPVGVNRTNLLWYNAPLFSRLGLAPPTTFDETVAVCEALAAEELVPLALGDLDQWVTAHLFETLLLGAMGAGTYRGLWVRQTSWTDGGVTDSLKRLNTLFGFVNENHAQMTWQQALGMVASGQAGMTVMGDWLDDRQRAAIGTVFGYVATPGSEGVFCVRADAFGLPRHAKNRDEAVQWLELAASRDGQDAFNRPNGSIPARADVGRAPYDSYRQSAIEAYETHTLVPSGIHEVGATADWAAGIADVIRAFSESGDVEAAQAALGQVCLDVGPCGAPFG